MKRITCVIAMLIASAGPLPAKSDKNMYPMPCSALWPAVRDTVRNSGNYAVVFLDSTDMIASFAIGTGNTLRIETGVLNTKGEGCELQVEPLYQGTFNDDAADFKKRIDTALGPLRQQRAETPPKN